MTTSKCAICISWLRLEEGGREKRKRPHIDQYEECKDNYFGQLRESIFRRETVLGFC
jgi:hypothetical protein